MAALGLCGRNFRLFSHPYRLLSCSKPSSSNLPRSPRSDEPCWMSLHRPAQLIYRQYKPCCNLSSTVVGRSNSSYHSTSTFRISLSFSSFSPNTSSRPPLGTNGPSRAKPSSAPHIPLEAGILRFCSWRLIAGVGIFLLSSAVIEYRTRTDPVYAAETSSADSPLSSPSTKTTREIVTYGGIKMFIPAGRADTLTATEEAKLKEMWIETLKIFGQYNSSILDDAATQVEVDDETNDSTLARSDSDPTSKKKKKRGLFGRSKKDKESPSHSRSVSTVTTGTSTPVGNASEEDKYGQTKDFKQALASQTPEQLRQTFWGFVKYDNPDGLLLRFLRARKWDVEKALVMMVSTMHWRGQEVKVEEVIMDGELGALTSGNEGFLKQLRMGKSFIHGVDKENRPVCYVRVKLHKQADQTEAALERYTIYLIETTRMLLPPPADTACILFDMTGFGLANMDYTPVKFMIKCFEAHYPESLGICLVHKAPWVFSSIWAIIKGWLDPVVANKVHFTKTLADLEAFIPKNRIIAELEGDEKWTYQYIEPSPTENDTLKDTVTRDAILADREKLIDRYEENTKKWIEEESLGADKATPVKDERKGLAEELRTGYWKLDPYIRAKTWYDRVGNIGKDGTIDLYSHEKKDTSADVPIVVPGPATSTDDLD